ncbi:hypothetical protein EV356DRAFT_103068 [Viridothelium virens]|uniref:Uncharacterized protein n=1 Tax=Viridothelium virens TaxID=1048519 RepID=A0A6A6HNX0_VIRVR|nr:hypothetical protein EV356DRAFT_103068 [Viridothelium virens]
MTKGRRCCCCWKGGLGRPSRWFFAIGVEIEDALCWRRCPAARGEPGKSENSLGHHFGCFWCFPWQPAAGLQPIQSPRARREGFVGWRCGSTSSARITRTTRIKPETGLASWLQIYRRGEYTNSTVTAARMRENPLLRFLSASVLNGNLHLISST